MPNLSGASSRFATGDTVRYVGGMLPQLRNRDLTVLSAHVQSGFGDPATDDVCIVCITGHWFEYRVSSCNLRKEGK